MIIDGKLYRIKEEVYADGHKKYTAQRGYKILFFTIWRDFICDTWDYGYGSVTFICCGETYNDCLEHLKKSLAKQKAKKNKNTVVKINYEDVKQSN